MAGNGVKGLEQRRLNNNLLTGLQHSPHECVDHFAGAVEGDDLGWLNGFVLVGDCLPEFSQSFEGPIAELYICKRLPLALVQNVTNGLRLASGVAQREIETALRRRKPFNE